MATCSGSIGCVYEAAVVIATEAHEGQLLRPRPHDHNLFGVTPICKVCFQEVHPRYNPPHGTMELYATADADRHSRALSTTGLGAIQMRETEVFAGVTGGVEECLKVELQGWVYRCARPWPLQNDSVALSSPFQLEDAIDKGRRRMLKVRYDTTWKAHLGRGN